MLYAILSNPIKYVLIKIFMIINITIKINFQRMRIIFVIYMYEENRLLYNLILI
jgi:hypothetical protein